MFYGHGRVNAEQALLMTPSQPVGGEAKIMDSIDEITEGRFSTSLIMFGAILTTIMVGILSQALTKNIKNGKIQLYKSLFTYSRELD